MTGSSQQVFRYTQLDSGLLSTPVSLQTNWHVITGASCSGKTTLIEQLAGVGFQTVPEAGRLYFKRELGQGRTIDEIRQDRAAFTRRIYAMGLKMEQGLPATEITFFDRGLPDCLAFYRIAGLDPNEILPDCTQHRYASVFILDRFPYQQDGVRGGDDAYAAYLDSWIERDYTALGYQLVRVPVLPPEERLAFVLERLSEQGLI